MALTAHPATQLDGCMHACKRVCYTTMCLMCCKPAVRVSRLSTPQSEASSGRLADCPTHQAPPQGLRRRHGVAKDKRNHPHAIEFTDVELPKAI